MNVAPLPPLPPVSSRTPRVFRLLSVAWAVVLVAVAAHQVWFWRSASVDTDVMALLPEDERHPELALATQRLAEKANHELVVLVGAASWEEATRAADLAKGVLLAKGEDGSPTPLEWTGAVVPDAKSAKSHQSEAERSAEGSTSRDASADSTRERDTSGGAPSGGERDPRSVDESEPGEATTASPHDAADEVLDFYAPFRNRLLTDAQRASLQEASGDALAQRALSQLYGPASARLTSWAKDPLGLWPEWWSERASESRARPREERLAFRADGKEFVVLPLRTTVSAFALADSRKISERVDAARDAVRAKHPDATVRAAGVALFAEAAATQASWEISVIGVGSFLAVLLLVWLSFRSVRPLLMVAFSLAVGCALALSVTSLLFGRVHLLTLVFGSSLVGVAEDYGFHYFTGRQGRPSSERFAVMKSLLPGLALALLTSVVGYLALGLAPFPGLRQMAVFSATGLLGAFLTVLCFFPAFDARDLPTNRFIQGFGALLDKWPRFSFGVAGIVSSLVFIAVVAGGLAVLVPSDDVRQLQSAPKALLDETRVVGQLLGLPSPSQFFLVRGSDVQTVLEREEGLSRRLQVLASGNVIAGHVATSKWVPSLRRQRADAALTLKLETDVFSAVSRVVDEKLERPFFTDEPLTLESWSHTPASRALAGQWLGEMNGETFSIVSLRGVERASLPELSSAAEGLEGIRFVDRTEELSSLLGRYRGKLGPLLALAHVAVAALLLARFRRRAWRVYLPTLLGNLLTVAVLGWLGIPFQLFVMLGLVLLLGTGIDYGIFLVEHPGDRAAWVSVALAGVSTLLSFGLLGLSSTPSLRAFGLTMLLGEVFIWFLTPLFRPPVGSSSHAS